MTISITHAGVRSRKDAARVPVLTYFAVWQQRRELSRLSPSRLRDLGISETDAAREAARPFWDMP